MIETNSILLVTGGTGGHIFPAKALAEELKKFEYNVYFAVDEKYWNYDVIDNKTSFLISSSSLDGSSLRKILASFKITKGVVQALILLNKIKPKVVVGFGGYTTFPTLIAAKLLKLPIILHEQNSLLGKANKVMLSSAKYLATSFAKTHNLSLLESRKAVFTGNPVRKDIVEVGSNPYPEINSASELRILVIGGSQGALIFNNIIPEAISCLTKEERARIKITQQIKGMASDMESLKAVYDKMGIVSELAPFFTNMAEQYSNCHLVISRAGASAIAELTMVNRPSILIPYPHSNNHQIYNTETLLEQKVSWVIEQNSLTKEGLAKLFSDILADSSVLIDMSEKMRNITIDGSKNLANLIMTEISKNSE